jgi:hypothetical protein
MDDSRSVEGQEHNVDHVEGYEKVVSSRAADERFSVIFSSRFTLLCCILRLNEIPASIARLLKKMVHCRLVDQLELVASNINMADELNSFLNHDPPQNK